MTERYRRLRKHPLKSLRNVLICKYCRHRCIDVLRYLNHLRNHELWLIPYWYMKRPFLVEFIHKKSTVHETNSYEPVVQTSQRSFSQHDINQHEHSQYDSNQSDFNQHDHSQHYDSEGNKNQVVSDNLKGSKSGKHLCTFCGKVFRAKGVLKKHVKLHKEDFGDDLNSTKLKNNSCVNSVSVLSDVSDSQEEFVSSKSYNSAFATNVSDSEDFYTCSETFPNSTLSDFEDHESKNSKPHSKKLIDTSESDYEVAPVNHSRSSTKRRRGALDTTSPSDDGLQKRTKTSSKRSGHNQKSLHSDGRKTKPVVPSDGSQEDHDVSKRLKQGKAKPILISSDASGSEDDCNNMISKATSQKSSPILISDSESNGIFTKINKSIANQPLNTKHTHDQNGYKISKTKSVRQKLFKDSVKTKSKPSAPKPSGVYSLSDSPSILAEELYSEVSDSGDAPQIHDNLSNSGTQELYNEISNSNTPELYSEISDSRTLELYSEISDSDRNKPDENKPDKVLSKSPVLTDSSCSDNEEVTSASTSCRGKSASSKVVVDDTSIYRSKSPIFKKSFEVNKHAQRKKGPSKMQATNKSVVDNKNGKGRAKSQRRKIKQVKSFEANADAPKNHQCGYCDDTFVDRDCLKNHMKVHLHEVLPDGSSSKNKSSTETTLRSCVYCGKNFKELESLKEHVDMHLEMLKSTSDSNDSKNLEQPVNDVDSNDSRELEQPVDDDDSNDSKDLGQPINDIGSNYSKDLEQSVDNVDSNDSEDLEQPIDDDSNDSKDLEQPIDDDDSNDSKDWEQPLDVDDSNDSTDLEQPFDDDIGFVRENNLQDQDGVNLTVDTGSAHTRKTGKKVNQRSHNASSTNDVPTFICDNKSQIKQSENNNGISEHPSKTGNPRKKISGESSIRNEDRPESLKYSEEETQPDDYLSASDIVAIEKAFKKLHPASTSEKKPDSTKKSQSKLVNGIVKEPKSTVNNKSTMSGNKSQDIRTAVKSKGNRTPVKSKEHRIPLKSQEDRTQMKSEDVSTTVNLQKDRTPVKSHDIKVPVESQKDSIPVKSQDIKVPVESRKDGTQVKLKDVKASVKSQNDRIPLKSKDVKAPVDSQKDWTPLKSKEHRIPLKSQEDTAQMKSQDVSATMNLQKDKTPVKSNGIKTTVEPQKDRTLVKPNDVKAPMESQKDKTPVKPKDVKTAVESQKDRTPVKSKDVKVQVKSQKDRTQVKSFGISTPVKSQDSRTSVKPNDVVFPEKSQSVKAPVESPKDNNKTPLKSHDVKLPVKSQNVKEPVKSQKNKTEVKSREVRTPVKSQDVRISTKSQEGRTPVKPPDVKASVSVKSQKNKTRMKSQDIRDLVKSLKDKLQVKSLGVNVKAPVKSQEDKTQLKSFDNRASIKSQEVRTSVTSDSVNAPVKSKEDCISVKSHDLGVVKYQDIRNPSVKSPMESQKSIRALVKLQDKRTPIKSQEVKSPLKSPEKRNLSTYQKCNLKPDKDLDSTRGISEKTIISKPKKLHPATSKSLDSETRSTLDRNLEVGGPLKSNQLGKGKVLQAQESCISLERKNSSLENERETLQLSSSMSKQGPVLAPKKLHPTANGKDSCKLLKGKQSSTAKEPLLKNSDSLKPNLASSDKTQISTKQSTDQLVGSKEEKLQSSSKMKKQKQAPCSGSDRNITRERHQSTNSKKENQSGSCNDHHANTHLVPSSKQSVNSTDIGFKTAKEHSHPQAKMKVVKGVGENTIKSSSNQLESKPRTEMSDENLLKHSGISKKSTVGKPQKEHTLAEIGNVDRKKSSDQKKHISEEKEKIQKLGTSQSLNKPASQKKLWTSNMKEKMNFLLKKSSVRKSEINNNESVKPALKGHLLEQPGESEVSLQHTDFENDKITDGIENDHDTIEQVDDADFSDSDAEVDVSDYSSGPLFVIDEIFVCSRCNMEFESRDAYRVHRKSCGKKCRKHSGESRKLEGNVVDTNIENPKKVLKRKLSVLNQRDSTCEETRVSTENSNDCKIQQSAGSEKKAKEDDDIRKSKNDTEPKCGNDQIIHSEKAAKGVKQLCERLTMYNTKKDCEKVSKISNLSEIGQIIKKSLKRSHSETDKSRSSMNRIKLPLEFLRDETSQHSKARKELNIAKDHHKDGFNTSKIMKKVKRSHSENDESRIKTVRTESVRDEWSQYAKSLSKDHHDDDLNTSKVCKKSLKRSYSETDESRMKAIRPVSERDAKSFSKDGLKTSKIFKKLNRSYSETDESRMKTIRSESQKDETFHTNSLQESLVKKGVTSIKLTKTSESASVHTDNGKSDSIQKVFRNRSPKKRWLSEPTRKKISIPEKSQEVSRTDDEYSFNQGIEEESDSDDGKSGEMNMSKKVKKRDVMLQKQLDNIMSISSLFKPDSDDLTNKSSKLGHDNIKDDRRTQKDNAKIENRNLLHGTNNKTQKGDKRSDVIEEYASVGEKSFTTSAVTDSKKSSMTKNQMNNEAQNKDVGLKKCRRCEKGFATRSAYEDHKKLCSGNSHDEKKGNADMKRLEAKVDVCQKCKRGFLTASAYADHKKLCTVPTKHSSEFGMKCLKTSNMKSVSKVKLPLEDVKTSSGYKTGHSVQEAIPSIDHKQSAWLDSGESSEIDDAKDKKVKCNCKRCAHCHSAAKDDKEDSLKEKDKRDRRGVFPCPVAGCKRVLQFKSSLKIHIATHMSVRELHQCDKCDKSFLYERNLAEHKLSHEGHQFVCGECGIGFNNRCSLANHQEKGHEDKGIDQFVCDHQKCGQVFKDMRRLKIHKFLTHSKKFKCTQCYLVFVSRDKYISHVKYKECEKLPHHCTMKNCANCNPRIENQQNQTARKVLEMDEDACGSRRNGKSNEHLKTKNDGVERKCLGKTLKSEHRKDNLNMKIGNGERLEKVANRTDDKTRKGMDETNLKRETESVTSKPSKENKDSSSNLFVCIKCKKAFITQEYLDQHQKKHKKTIFRCHLCGKKYLDKYNLQNHKLEHMGHKFMCGECGSEFTSMGGLKQHQKAGHEFPPPPDTSKPHYGDVDLECPSPGCDKTFKSRVELTHHKIVAHKKGKVLKCDECSQQFISEKSLIAHRDLHNDKSRPHKCKLCGLRFRHRATLHSHIFRFHRRTSGMEKDIAMYSVPAEFHDKIKVIKKEDGTLRYKCTLCNKKCLSLRQFSIHAKMAHMGKEIFRCRFCLKKFHTRFLCISHEATHKDIRTFKCMHCSKTFRTKSHLQQHEAIHTGETNFPCHLCDYKCNSSGSLKLHLRTHTKEKPYKCSYSGCNMTFAGLSNCKRHERSHSDERPHKCDICSKAFKSLGEVKMHKVSHSDALNFACKLCGKKFRAQSTLRLHMTKHTGLKKHKCNICEKKYYTSWELKTHERTHTDERPFKCRHCSKWYRSSSNRLEHEKRAHLVTLKKSKKSKKEIRKE